MDTTTESGSLADFLVTDETVTQLEAPSQLSVSRGEYSGKILLSWTPVSYAKSYYIERAYVLRNSDGTWSEPDETDFSCLKEHVYGTTFTDIILSDPQSDNEEYDYVYYYRIQAENIGKGYTASEFTDFTVEQTNGAGWLFAPPKNVDAWKGKNDSQIKISWDAVDNADFYRIYRGISTVSMERIGTTYASQREFINSVTSAEQGVEYYFKVTAVNKLGIESERSSEALGYALKEGAPIAPETVTVTNGIAKSKNSLNITWSAVSVSEESSLTYSLYRTSSVNSVYTLIKSGLTLNSYTDQTVKTGIIYYYYIQSVVEKSGETIKSAFSETGSDSSNPAVGFLLSAPVTIEVTDGSDSTYKTVRWQPCAGASIAQSKNIPLTYSIYYSEEAEGDYKTLTDTPILPALDSDEYFSYEVEKKPFYKISTWNLTDFLESSLSSAVAPMPSAPINVTASKTLYIEENWTANSNNVYPVKITWQKPLNDSPAGYYIYRSTKVSSAFKKLNETAVTPLTGSDSEILSYIDVNESAKSGTIYYYKVVSVNSLNQGKKSNDPANDSEHKCIGWGALTRDQWFREYNKTIIRSQSKLTLMHKSSDTDKLGSETISGDISGTLGYKAAISGLGARITMPYTNYSDFYISNDEALGVYFLLNGNTNTTSDMSGSGSMDGNVVCTGMYPGTAWYDNLKIKGGAAGGGYYDVETRNLDGKVVLSNSNGDSATRVDWLVGEEER